MFYYFCMYYFLFEIVMFQYTSIFFSRTELFYCSKISLKWKFILLLHIFFSISNCMYGRYLLSVLVMNFKEIIVPGSLVIEWFLRMVMNWFINKKKTTKKKKKKQQQQQQQKQQQQKT